jgi:hypothetical protein
MGRQQRRNGQQQEFLHHVSFGQVAGQTIAVIADTVFSGMRSLERRNYTI